jgi:hypothetical protein
MTPACAGERIVTHRCQFRIEEAGWQANGNGCSYLAVTDSLVEFGRTQSRPRIAAGHVGDALVPELCDSAALNCATPQRGSQSWQPRSLTVPRSVPQSVGDVPGPSGLGGGLGANLLLDRGPQRTYLAYVNSRLHG